MAVRRRYKLTANMPARIIHSGSSSPSQRSALQRPMAPPASSTAGQACRHSKSGSGRRISAAANLAGDGASFAGSSAEICGCASGRRTRIWGAEQAGQKRVPSSTAPPQRWQGYSTASSYRRDREPSNAAGTRLRRVAVRPRAAAGPTPAALDAFTPFAVLHFEQNVLRARTLRLDDYHVLVVFGARFEFNAFAVQCGSDVGSFPVLANRGRIAAAAVVATVRAALHSAIQHGAVFLHLRSIELKDFWPRQDSYRTCSY